MQFFFLHTFPPMRTCACSLASFSWFIISFIFEKQKKEHHEIMSAPPAKLILLTSASNFKNLFKSKTTKILCI